MIQISRNGEKWRHKRWHSSVTLVFIKAALLEQVYVGYVSEHKCHGKDKDSKKKHTWKSTLRSRWCLGPMTREAELIIKHNKKRRNQQGPGIRTLWHCSYHGQSRDHKQQQKCIHLYCKQKIYNPLLSGVPVMVLFTIFPNKSL